MSDKNSIPQKELQKIEDLAIHINQFKKSLNIGTSSLTPLNYQEEYDKFFTSTSYNPQYVYKKRNYPDVAAAIDRYKKDFHEIAMPADLQEHIQDFLDSLKILYFTKRSIGSEDFTKYASQLFDWGTDRLDLLLSSTPKVPFTMDITHVLRDANFIKKRFESTLAKYGIKSFTVNLDTFSPHIINVGFQNIFIGDAIKRFECNIDRLIVHEIESHVLQMENTKNSPTALAGFAKYGNQHLYGEGLAIYNEITTRKITPSAYEMYFSRIRAVRMLSKSFREIFDILSQTLTQQRAFVITYRVKRGLSDTSLPGGFPKDASYLLGYHEIESLMVENFPKKLLYATKSPILSSLLAKYNLLDLDKVVTPRFS